MTMYCSYHKAEHDHFEWRSWGSGKDAMTMCRDALQEVERPLEGASFNIGGGKKENRIKHWGEIKSRVTTHDGQLLSGKAGREYQQKWSKKMLGRDLSKPANFNAPDYQRELAKTK
jgi:hypothetical protein